MPRSARVESRSMDGEQERNSSEAPGSRTADIKRTGRAPLPPARPPAPTHLELLPVDLYRIVKVVERALSAALAFGPCAAVPALAPPNPRQVSHGRDALRRIAALGQRIAVGETVIPLHPRLSL